MSNRYKRIAVKIGSNVLTRADGTLDITRMSAIVDQVADLHHRGVGVIIISSGAVASGRSLLSENKKLDAVSARQLYSAVGQAKLINRYYELFREHGIACGQVLTTKENFSTRRHYLNQKHCMEVMLANDVIPIVNENDSVEVEEIKIGENDTLSALVATFIGADKLIMLTDVDAFYDGSPDDEASRPIPVIEVIDDRIRQLAGGAGSDKGTGGMFTKVSAAEIATSAGIDVHIVFGKKPDLIYDVLDGKRAGTVFKKKKQEN